MTNAERASIDNGIWLCGQHARLIDRDEVRFPLELLRSWKAQRLAAAELEIGQRVPQIVRRGRGSRMTSCQDCGQEVSWSAQRCPCCDSAEPVNRWWWSLVAYALLAWVAHLFR
jgi:hypothetical protein